MSRDISHASDKFFFNGTQDTSIPKSIIRTIKSDVTFISLSDNKLIKIPRKNKNLFHLQHLDLSRNDLTKFEIQNPQLEKLILSSSIVSEMQQFPEYALVPDISFNRIIWVFLKSTSLQEIEMYLIVSCHI
jgi:Leucine-rich repeat (LRR) protein